MKVGPEGKLVESENEKSEDEFPVAVMVESKGLLNTVMGSFAVMIWVWVVCRFCPSLLLRNLRDSFIVEREVES